MLTLNMLAWATVVGALLSYWWQSDKIKNNLMGQVLVYCRQHHVQFLDQSMVLKGLAIRRTELGLLGLLRRYQFEFTSTGEQRYRGTVEAIGRKLQGIELEPHLLPDDNDLLN